jgi:peptidoglycan hydrolase-like protein with peptidoglycan-binding domain
VTRKTWLAGSAVAVAIAVAATGGVVVMSSATQATQVAQEPRPNTVKVKKGKLSAMVSLNGTLTYRARSDGSPYSVVNQVLGRYTELPDEGDKVECGDVLYRVDNKPVLLLCGTVPAYRDLWFGDVGKDVGQLNRNLHTLGYDARAGVDINPDDNAFTDKTVRAFQLFQHDKGFSVTGVLTIGEAVFLPESVRIVRVTGDLGGSAQQGAQVVSATSDTPEVQVNLEPSQQGEVKEGDSAQIKLPGQQVVTGTVARLGRVAQVPAAQQNDGRAVAATILAYLSLDEQEKAKGLDKAPVQVEIATRGVENALSVPVTALVGKSGGGFAVEVVRDGGRRELVTVKLGLFDTAGGRVQVEGELGEGDQVVVPSL